MTFTYANEIGDGLIKSNNNKWLCIFFSAILMLYADEIYRKDGQVSWEKVLVYRNPGLHFGDIHVLKATYVKELEDFVGTSKYAIFFPCNGPRSLADEIAGGDFDGDMYFVSRNPEVGIYCTLIFIRKLLFMHVYVINKLSIFEVCFALSICNCNVNFVFVPLKSLKYPLYFEFHYLVLFYKVPSC